MSALSEIAKLARFIHGTFPDVERVLTCRGETARLPTSMKFASREQTSRLDAADTLAEVFGLELAD